MRTVEGMEAVEVAVVDGQRCHSLRDTEGPSLQSLMAGLVGRIGNDDARAMAYDQPNGPASGHIFERIVEEIGDEAR